MRVGDQGVSSAAATLAREAAHLKARSRWPSSALPALWFLTDEHRTPDPAAIARTLPAGTGIVLRHYRDPRRRAIAEALAALARGRKLVLLIGADWRLAAEVGAHGVHVPRWAKSRRRQLHKSGLITYSVHGLIEMQSARASGADAVFLGPAFLTASHAETQALGTVRFSALSRLSPCPVIALGGIEQKNARRLNGAGAYGLGAIGALIPSTEK